MPGASEFTTRPELAGTFGMVASTHWLASAAGLSVLEKGGNAFDAAVAAGLVLQVVEPHLCGPGGEVPIIGFDVRRGRTFVVDGQGPAPRTATPGAFAALDVDLIPGNGLLAACVPGAFGAWMLLLRDHGVARLRDVMSYAIDYAGGGYPVVPAVSGAIASVAGMFRDHWPSSAELYLPGGQVPPPGARFSNPRLAATYQRILDEAEAAARGRDEQIDAARQVFYEGFVAEALADYLDFAEVMDVTGRPNRGLLGYDDIAAWRPGVETPLTFDYAGLTVCKTQPWGQGPVFLQQLSLLAGFDLAAMGPGSADFIHTVAECAKLAFADREAWYGDPRFTDVPIRELLSPGYAGQRRRLVGETASPDLIPGAPGGAQPHLPAFAIGPFGRSTAPVATMTRGPARAVTRALIPAWRPASIPARASRRCRPAPAGAGTPATSTSPTGSATSSRPPPAGPGCNRRRWSRPLASAWAPGRRCSHSSPGCRRRWRPASAPAPRCPRASRCVTASPTWRSAPPAGTSRTSGRWPSSSTTCISA